MENLSVYQQEHWEDLELLRQHQAQSQEQAKRHQFNNRFTHQLNLDDFDDQPSQSTQV